MARPGSTTKPSLAAVRSAVRPAVISARRAARRLPRRRVWLPYRLHPAIQAVPDWVLRRDPRDCLNQVCDISDWRIGRFTDVLRELHEGVRVHRKAWEYAKLVAGLERLGVLGPEALGVSVGAGAEGVLFYLANRIRRIVATDLYVTEAERWGWKADFMADPASHAPFDFRREALEVRNMSGTALEFEDSTFDFAYSLSSIEHFGGTDAARTAVQEMSRVVRPGGVICVVTDLQLSKRQTGEAFPYPVIAESIIEGAGLQPEGPVDLRISETLLAHPVQQGAETDEVSPHIVLADWDPAGQSGHGGSVWTSIIFFMRKPV